MRQTLEAIFSHPLQLLCLIIALPIVGVAVAYFLVPRTYQSTASLWALRRYAVIGATGPESDLTSTPAQTQATALTELLQTRTFALAIEQATNLASSLNLDPSVLSDPQQLQDALLTEISKNVVVTTIAYNLFEVSYTNRNPVVAQQVVKAVITNYGEQSLGLSIAEGQILLGSYQTQFANAQKSANDAVAAETKYAAAHPTEKIADDPQYAQLDTARLQALTVMQNLQNTMNVIQQSISSQGTNASTLFQTIDAPQMPERPVSRLKQYLVGGGGGLGVAILACAIYLVILVRRDRGIYSASDLGKSGLFPVVMQLPSLTPASVSLLITQAEQISSLSEGGKSSANSHSSS